MKSMVSTWLTLTALACFGQAPPASADNTNQQKKDRLDRTLSMRYESAPTAESADSSQLAEGTELVRDGGFETGSSPSGSSSFTVVSSAWTWQYSGTGGSPNTRYYNSTSGPAHSGNWCLYFDLGPSQDHLFQDVSIPSGSSATLSFWLKVGTSETGTSVYDTLIASVTDRSGTVPAATLSFSNRDAAGGYRYVQRTLDVSAFAGKTVRLQFDTNADSTGDTIFILDDVSILSSATSTTACTNSQTTICLNSGRFKIEGQYTLQDGQGSGALRFGAPLTGDSGYFYFNNASDAQGLVKVLNACAASLGNRYWVFIGALTDQGVTMTVTDTKADFTGVTRSKTYSNPLKTAFLPVQDTSAFATCP